MPETRPDRMVGIVLRCYPRRWRGRHGDDAAELAALLIQDGVPARSIAWSYLHGAARERLVPRAGRRLAATAGALLAVAVSVGTPLGLLAASVPASAASAHASARRDPATQRAPLLGCRGLLGEPAWQAPPAARRTAGGHDKQC